MLRCAIMQYDKEWDELLGITELCYNASPYESIGFVHHKIVYGIAAATPLSKIQHTDTSPMTAQSIYLIYGNHEGNMEEVSRKFLEKSKYDLEKIY